MAIAIVSAGSAYAVSHVSAAPVTSNDAFAIVGHVTMVLYDNESGEIKAYRQSDNLVVNDGLETILDYIFGDTLFGSTGLNGVTETVVSHMALGNKVSPPVANATATGLDAEVSACTRIAIAGSATGLTATLTATFDAAADNNCAVTVSELGLFTESAAGGNDQLFAKQSTFTPITLTTADSLAVTWTVGMADDGTGD